MNSSLSLKLLLLTACGFVFTFPLYAGDKTLTVAEDKAVVDDNQEGLEKTLEYNFSPEDRALLRKALSDYAKNTDPEHIQIEKKRKEMKESIKARFNQCNEDLDDSIDRQEATECLPQIARHFNYVDVDGDGVITLEELELAQAKMDERHKAAEARIEAKRLQQIEEDIKNKSKEKLNKQVSNNAKHPS